MAAIFKGQALVIYGKMQFLKGFYWDNIIIPL